MSRVVAIGLLCLLLALPATAEESGGLEGLWSQIWEGFVEIFGLGDHADPVEPPAVSGENSSTSPPSDEVGPIIIPNG